MAANTMNFNDLIYVSEAERLMVKAVHVQEELNRLKEVTELAEACCDLYNQTFVGEVAEA
jgi:hypothetical protein